MAKIIYGIEGEGFGHAMRTKVVAQHLLEAGHQLKFVSYDQGYDSLSQLYPVARIGGLRIEYKDNAVQYLSTLGKNLAKVKDLAEGLGLVSDLIDDWQPDLIISDFEPTTALAAKLKKIPLVALDNQHIITRTKVDYPQEHAQDALAAKTVVRLMVNRAAAYIIPTFFKPPVSGAHTYLLPPILRPEILTLQTSRQDAILVYLNTSKFSGLVEVLKRVKADFIIYGLDRTGNEGNMHFRAIKDNGFLADLAACSGIIANAGFTLISEALYLGKPYLALPMRGQFEQLVNGYYLQRLGYGDYGDELDRAKIEDFIARGDDYRRALKSYQRQGNARTFKKIDQVIERLLIN